MSASMKAAKPIYSYYNICQHKSGKIEFILIIMWAVNSVKLDKTGLLRDTIFEKVVNMIGGKWKLRIIYVLAFHEVLRYGESKRLLSPITHKMLSTQLKELEKDGLVNRKEYQQIPPKVEYSLTQMGRDLKPVVKEIHNWILQYDIQGE